MTNRSENSVPGGAGVAFTATCAPRPAVCAAVLAALLVTAAGAAPARAQPEATGEPEAASAPRSREPTRDPARPALPEETAADEAPQIFVPSEEISGDTVVSFPVDI